MTNYRRIIDALLAAKPYIASDKTLFICNGLNLARKAGKLKQNDYWLARNFIRKTIGPEPQVWPAMKIWDSVDHWLKYYHPETYKYFKAEEISDITDRLIVARKRRADYKLAWIDHMIKDLEAWDAPMVQ